MLPFEQRVPGTARAHQAWADGGDLDALVSQLGPQTFGQSDERELARAVGNEMRHADLAADRCDVHDAAGSLPAHPGQDGKNCVERPQKFTFIARLKSSTSIVSTGPTAMVPALLISASILPSPSVTSCTMRVTASLSVTSHRSARTEPPSRSRSSRARSSVSWS